MYGTAARIGRPGMINAEAEKRDNAHLHVLDGGEGVSGVV
jgi:hypothetical protein